MEPNEAREHSVLLLLDQIEKQYQDLLIRANASHDARKKFIYLTEMIELLDKAPKLDDPILADMMRMHLYLKRSELAVEAEFVNMTFDM